MRILLAHNYYQSGSPSGEDSVFRNERQLLESHGHEVVSYERHNDSIAGDLASKAHAAVEALWSRRTYRDIAALVRKHRPDVAHFHNTFPQISPSAYAACGGAGVAVVQTLHNYRLICPGALLLRDGHPCEDCIGRSALPAIRHACYRQSSTATAIVATMLSIHRARRTYTQAIDRYVALTAFAKQRFIRGGLPGERIVVRPNCLMDDPAVGAGNGDYALYVGRLSAEKGIRTLVDAWLGVDVPLRIAGDGVLRAELEARARESGARIEFLGFRSRPEVLSLMRDARCLIIPSECYEGFPVTVLEALACGTPLIVAAIGALDEIIAAPRHGVKFAPRDPASLRTAARELLSDKERLERIRWANRELFERQYSSVRGIESLLDVYRQARSPCASPVALAQPA